MNRHIFRRIFVLYAVVFVAALVLVEVSVTDTVRESYIANIRSSLLAQIDLAADRISFGEARLDGLCRRLKSESGARVTVIGSDGTVLGDSDRDSAGMDNHLHRTEVEQADLAGTGSTVRYSNTLKYDFLYVARKIDDRESGGFIRFAVPLRDVDRSVNGIRLKVLLVVAGVLLAMWGFGVWQTDHLRRLLSQIARFSRALARGEIDKRLYLTNAGEFTEIADNLTSMSSTLELMMTECMEEKKQLSVVLQSVPDALLIIDEKGVVTLLSVSARDYFGSGVSTGVSFADIVRNHEFGDLIEEVRAGRLSGMSEITIDTPRERSLAVQVSPLFFREGELSGFVAVFHDITESRKLEQVRKDFVANVSHELKTPITAIMGFADTLLDGALSDKEHATKFVETIKSNSERINSLVDDLMTISKIEMGVIKVEKQLVDVDGVFENILALFRDRASAKGLRLEVAGSPEIRRIEADRNRLVQILTNLVDNAVKFTETGGVTMGIEREEGRTVLFVKDTGPGVAAKFLPRLGERFFRVDPARSRKLGGTGLGLAIVKHLVKAHGWTMRLESVHGKGMTVKIVVGQE